MRDDVLDVLLSEGPQLSGQLAVALEKWLGITPAAARKKVERRSTAVRELKLSPAPQRLLLRSSKSRPSLAITAGEGWFIRPR